ncbi:MAG TPA: NADP-dependent oxidoreductase [Chitinophagaceae bacterium]|nr:NADP-dependent oxidoreductase [Chitinophagaceae bacterium]
MKAVRIHGYGGPEVLKYEEAPVPEPGVDDILVRIHSAAVNPVDWKIRNGISKAFPIDFPFILGWDLAGTVVEAGKMVRGFKAGDKVFARPDTMRNGAYAEYIAMRACEATFAPTSIPPEQAAGVPLAAQTAWVGLFEAGRLKPGQKVLIHGGSGAVGIFAVQLAAIAGAQVTATTSEKNIDLVRSLGASQVINYQGEDFTKKVKDLDLVLDTIGGETQKKSWDLIRGGGSLVSTVGVDAGEAQRRGIRGIGFMLQAHGARLAEIGKLIDEGRLKVIIEREFPLSETRKAQELSAQGHARGKIIIRIE